MYQPSQKQWQRIKHAIRNKYAWPGGYPLYLVMCDGESMSIDAARENYKLICRAYITGDYRDSWAAYDADINYEDENLYCAHTNKKIESAYGPDDAE